MVRRGSNFAPTVPGEGRIVHRRSPGRVKLCTDGPRGGSDFANAGLKNVLFVVGVWPSVLQFVLQSPPIKRTIHQWPESLPKL